jgi:hypothetical protein
LKSIHILDRLPNRQAILQVYAVIAVMFSAWTIPAFLWKLSAWLLILNIGEILTVFSYAMVVDLLESLTVLLLLLILCVLLPAPILRDDFVVRGTIIAAGLIGSLMAFVKLHMEFGIESGTKLLIGPLAVLLLTVMLLAFPPKFRLVRFLHAAIQWISDRLLVFLYILVPLFVALLAYVIFRNIM